MNERPDRLHRSDRPPIERRAARLLLVDDADRILLFDGFDPHEPAAGRWWFTPGGGVEGDETIADAAHRELAEETGLRVGSVGPVVWRRTAEFTFEGTRYRQQEWFHLVRCDRLDVDISGFDAAERRSISGHRWWSVAELAASPDVVYPEDLAARLSDLLVGGRPPIPLDLDG